MTEHDENDVRHALSHLVASEPELGLGVDRVVRQGRALRRRRRAVRVGLPIATIALLAVGGAASLVVLDDGAPTEPQLTVASAAMPLTDAGRATISETADTVTTERGKLLLKAIDSASGAGYTYGLEETDIGVPTLDGTVEDSEGAGRLMISVTNTKGMFTVHPCSDSEFVAGSTCTETTLPDGSYLSERGLVDYKGIKTYIVNITRDDGTGVSAESGNFTLPEAPTTLRAEDKKEFQPGGKYGPVISRSTPIYDVPALAKMVRLVAAETSDWPTEPMKVSGR